VRTDIILGHFFAAYYTGYLLLTLIVVLRWRKKTTIQREKKQANLLLASAPVMLISGFLFNTLLPLFEIRVVPAIGEDLALIFVGIISYSIIKYKFMHLTSSIAADEIMARIKDLIILIDTNQVIIKINSYTLELMGYGENQLIGKSMKELAHEGGITGEEYSGLMEIFLRGENSVINYRISIGEVIPFQISGSVIRDNTDDILGTLIVLHDLRSTKMLETEIEKRKETNLKLEKVNTNLNQTNMELKEAQRIASIDMMMAINVQSNLFPKESPLSDEWDIAFEFTPVSGVSGDMYDFYTKDGELKGLSLFDVSGHGIASGLITMLGKSILYRLFHASMDLKLNRIMEKFNSELINDLNNVDNYLTGVLLRFNENNIEYVNAGHTDLLCRKIASKTAKIVKPNQGVDFKGMFLGIKEMADKYKMISFPIEKGDSMLLYSDCLIEATGPDYKSFGMQNLLESYGNAPDGSAKEILDHITSDLYDYTGSEPLNDDLTIIVIKKS